MPVMLLTSFSCGKKKMFHLFRIADELMQIDWSEGQDLAFDEKKNLISTGIMKFLKAVIFGNIPSTFTIRRLCPCVVCTCWIIGMVFWDTSYIYIIKAT